jgi:hypothetical protein
MDPRLVLLAALAGLGVYGSEKAVVGIRKINLAISRKLHHAPKAETPQKEETKQIDPAK